MCCVCNINVSCLLACPSTRCRAGLPSALAVNPVMWRYIASRKRDQTLRSTLLWFETQAAAQLQERVSRPMWCWWVDSSTYRLSPSTHVLCWVVLQQQERVEFVPWHPAGVGWHHASTDSAPLLQDHGSLPTLTACTPEMGKQIMSDVVKTRWEQKGYTLSFLLSTLRLNCLFSNRYWRTLRISAANQHRHHHRCQVTWLAAPLAPYLQFFLFVW